MTGAANGERVRRWFQDKKAGWYAVLEDPHMPVTSTLLDQAHNAIERKLFIMKAFHHPGGSQRAFLTGLAHLYNLVPSPVKVTLRLSLCYTPGLLSRFSEGGHHAGQSLRTCCGKKSHVCDGARHAGPPSSTWQRMFMRQALRWAIPTRRCSGCAWLGLPTPCWRWEWQPCAAFIVLHVWIVHSHSPLVPTTWPTPLTA
jgi:hypothetical protein